MCKACNRCYQREHYLRNRPDYLTKATVWSNQRREQNRVRILSYLADHPCTDCGDSDPLVLQFDHVRGAKVDEVSRLAQSGSTWARIAAEIEKCDVRCAACHSRRHAVDGRWLKWSLASGRHAESAPPSPLRQRQTPADRSGLLSQEELKWCGSCGLDLPITDFATRGQRRRSGKCKHCQRAYSRDHYRRNRAVYLARDRTRNRRTSFEFNMTRLVEYLRTHPCVDCGQSSPVVLQFDHVRGEKLHNLGRLVRDGVRWETVAAEIAKCDVRCVNCHFRRHAELRGSRPLAKF